MKLVSRLTVIVTGSAMALTPLAIGVPSQAATKSDLSISASSSRLESLATSRPSRSGRYVTINTWSSKWSPSLHHWVLWGNHSGTIQYYSAHKWLTLRTIHQNSGGFNTTTFKALKVRSYRVAFPATTTVRGVTTAAASA